jgi:putative hemolysin
MNAEHLPFLVLLPVLLIAIAIFSAAEATFFGLTGGDRMRLRRQSPRAHLALNRLLKSPRRLLVANLLYVSLMVVAYFTAADILIEGVEQPWAKVSLKVATILCVILFSELLPKVLAFGHRVTFARLLAPIMEGAIRLAWPVIAVLDAVVIAPLSRLLRPAGAGESPPVSAEELDAVLDIGSRRGVLDLDEQRLLAAVVRLGDVRIREIMVPRVDIRWISPSASAAQVAALVRESGHTKLPVCVGSLDGRILGLLNAKTYLAAASRDSGTPLSKHINDLRYVPERARLSNLLDHFRTTKSHVAMCVDEVGQVTGLVEIEDAVNELLASAAERDVGEDEGVRQVGPGEWLAPGRLSVRDWAELFGRGELERAVANGRVATIAGLLMSRLGRLPRVGDEVRVRNVRLRVEAMEGRIIQSVRLRVDAADSGTPQESAA